MSYPDSPTYLEIFGENIIESADSLIIPLFNLQEVLQNFSLAFTRKTDLLIGIHESLRRTLLSYILNESRGFLSDGITTLVGDYSLYYTGLKCITLGKIKQGEFDIFGYAWEFLDNSLPPLDTENKELVNVNEDQVIIKLEVLGNPATTLDFCKAFLSYLKTLNSPSISVKYNYWVEIFTYSSNTIFKTEEVVNG